MEKIWHNYYYIHFMHAYFNMFVYRHIRVYNTHFISIWVPYCHITIFMGFFFSFSSLSFILGFQNIMRILCSVLSLIYAYLCEMRPFRLDRRKKKEFNAWYVQLTIVTIIWFCISNCALCFLDGKVNIYIYI